MANDAIEQFLSHNNGDRTFSEVALDSGAALSSSGKMLSGMGVVFQDYDSDGLPDLLVTQLPHEPYVVFHFTMTAKVCSARGNWKQDLVVCPWNSSGWGVGLEDFDNDCWKDVFVAQGSDGNS